MSEDHERIYLEPDSDTSSDRFEGRLWCCDKIDDDWTEYVRADLFDRLRNRERELVDGLERTITALEAALEELRLIRMKDCGAVYDNMIRRFGPVAAQDARSLIGGDQ